MPDDNGLVANFTLHPILVSKSASSLLALCAVSLEKGVLVVLDKAREIAAWARSAVGEA